MDSSDLFDKAVQTSSEIDASHVSDFNWKDKSEIEAFLRGGTSGSAKSVVENLFARIGNVHLNSTLLRLYIVTDIYLIAKSNMESIGIPKEIFVEAFGDTDAVIKHFKSQDTTKTYIIFLLEKCVELRNIQINSSKSIISQSKKYIGEHFNEADISLSTVAASVNICPTYFCYLFKKELGETFVAYLTDVRMKKAKELLCCSSKMIAEIAEEVGYNDYHYFTGIFKKLNGITPSEFRKLNNQRK